MKEWICFLPIIIMLFLLFISPKPKPGQVIERTAKSDNYAMVVGMLLGAILSLWMLLGGN